MRDRAWRRYIEDKKVMSRLNTRSSRWRYFAFFDVNGIQVILPNKFDHVGKKESFLYKTQTTEYNDSKFKSKYSPNKSKHYSRSGDYFNRRETQKIIFLKLLKDYGLK